MLRAYYEAQYRNALVTARGRVAERRVGIPLAAALFAGLVWAGVAVTDRVAVDTADFVWVVAGVAYTGLAFSVVLIARDFMRWRAGCRPTVSKPVPFRRRITRLWKTSSASVPGWVVTAAMAVIVIALVLTTAVDVPVRDPGRASADIDFGIFVALATSLPAAALIELTGRFATRHLPAHPFDAALPALTGLVGSARGLAPAWDRGDVPRYLAHHVEDVARQACRATPWTARAAVLDRGTRSELRRPGRELAAILRSHKPDLATPSSRSAFDAEVATLTARLLAMASGDDKAVTDGAPVSERRRPLVAYLYRRALPALVSALVALALPWLKR